MGVAADRVKPFEPQVGRAGSEKKRKLDPAVAAQAPAPTLNTHDESAAGELDAATQREHEAATRVKNINMVVLGKWEIHTWYFSPFPKGFSECDTLYFCEFDLHFVKTRQALQRYLRRNDIA